MTTYWCERAWLGPRVGVVAGIAVEVERGRITWVDPMRAPAAGAVVLTGIVVPGFANSHSHAFHRALRGRTQRGGGSFWSWREQMYLVADRLDPDSFHHLAEATYAEMASVGITAVGEFHYLHHGPGGRPYDDPNTMGHALITAARAAGLRICLLDTCYLNAGFGRPATGVQARFSDRSADRWAARVTDMAAAYADADDVMIGAAIHSVRGVPADQLDTVADWARARDVPLHLHLSEQPAENADCLAATGLTPTELLAEHGVLGPATTVVHATHLGPDDIATLGRSRSYACFCPTTERDLADGIGPSRQLVAAGAALTLGTDSHAVIDMCEEMRAVELDERLLSLRRGAWDAGELIEVATATGQASLGFADAGGLAVGRRADLVAVRSDSVRTAGTGLGAETVVFAASGADVTDVIVDGRRVVAEGSHHRLPGAAHSLEAAVTALLDSQ